MQVSSMSRTCVSKLLKFLARFKLENNSIAQFKGLPNKQNVATLQNFPFITKQLILNKISIYIIASETTTRRKNIQFMT